ncbi:hypothetical protein LZZ85_06480 [Terrimonas sp. NA20]|uniref:Uncharacterized protein n=1 Tax=Terrimonas ginsenosidimutans TaxID=2908004 RepID=A0ABS9KNM4_9BACT|nr:hypothetical protein [Terrimonas ginsenosidimutans]MCG2613918.1 hypothetical protein [Terrimonas ginsenosidimutans]
MKLIFLNRLNRLLVFVFFPLSTVFIACNNNDDVSPGNRTIDDTSKAANRENCYDSARAYAALLENRVQRRMDYFNAKSAEKMLAPKFANVHIDTSIGRIYMQSFHDIFDKQNDSNNTKAVVITRKQLEFYLNYLDTSGEKAILMAFGRYDRDRLNNERVVDEELEIRTPDYHNRLTLIVGLPRYPLATSKRSNFIRPFVSGNKAFYDDWQGLWP